MVKLGWRNPRPNDFQTPDQRPLRDLFGNLQRFMTWPHAGVSITGAVPAAYGDMTLTAVNAPLALNEYDLVRNNTIQVPREFDSYIAVGASSAFVDHVGNGYYLLGWRLNNVTLNWISTVSSNQATDVRITCPLIKPVRKGDFLSVGMAAPVASTILGTSEAYIFFLPLV